MFRFIALAPRNSLIFFLKGYRRLISPLYGQVCRFYPSCSSYALTAVQCHGAIRGSTLAIRRLARCHPWSEGGVDDVPVKQPPPALTALGFVNWRNVDKPRTRD